MSEPLRTEPTPGREGTLPVDPAAQIERLLLAGLDLYFAGQLQDAINIWTRVVFLERGHSRARAYIERARTAIAEQQREADELFHRGRTAYERGSLDDARQLLTKAVERGGSSDDALLLLQQLNRFGTGTEQPRPVVPVLVGPRSSAVREAGRGWAWVLGAVAIVSAVALLTAPVVSWFGGAPVATDGAPVSAGRLEALPIVRTGDVAFESARQFYAGGHLADALRTLDRIDIGDPVRPQADRLKGEIQRDLLATIRRASPAAVGVTRR